jgi:hypothetical protein
MAIWNQANASGIGDVVVSPRDATVWVAGKSNGTVWFSKKPDRDYAGRQFTKIPATGCTRVSIWETESPRDFPSGELWAIAAGGTAWYCRYDTDKNVFFIDWTHTPTSGMVDVAVSPDGTIWLVGHDGSIFYSTDRAATVHKSKASGMARISVGPDGTLWAVGSNGTVWSCVLTLANSTAVTHSTEKWLQTGASGMGDVGVHPFLGTLWLAGKNGTIWSSTDRGKTFSVAGDATGFESVAAGSLNSAVDVWGVGSNESLWYKTTEYTPVLQTKYFNIQYDKTLGQAGISAATDLTRVVDSVYQSLADAFRLSPIPSPISLTLDAATGGGVSGFTTIDIHTVMNDGAGLPSYDLGQARYVFASEIAEVCMRAQKGGWNPSDSKGEALSRFYGEYFNVGGAAKYGYLTAQSWVNQLDRGDWVTVNRADDTTDVATGCALLFLNYMIFQKKLDLARILADRSPLLSQVYANLTGESDAYGPFRNLMEQHFPARTSFQSFPPPHYPYTLTSDNPFPL